VRTLLGKELRELASSRAALFVALAAGPLVAHGYSTAMDAFAEASGVPGGPAALTQQLSPLDGFVSPTLGAYALLATLLFPFVAIRSVSAEKESGAHILTLQGAPRVPAIVMSKFVALLLVWVVLWVPGTLALAFWSGAGGHLAGPETVGVLFGHFARGAFVAALGICCAAAAESGASAAVLALAVTLGG
jgi:ABC-type transport system involved in multi-copper enzyme maturation permease subunit